MEFLKPCFHFSEPKPSLGERMYAIIDSGDNICSFEISPPKSELGTCHLLRRYWDFWNITEFHCKVQNASSNVHPSFYSSLPDVYSACSPLFTAVTWHLQSSFDTSVPSRLPLGKSALLYALHQTPCWELEKPWGSFTHLTVGQE